MKYYLYPSSSQREISHVMNRLQNGAILTMGPLAEINYVTASNVSELIFFFWNKFELFSFVDDQNYIPIHNDAASIFQMKDNGRIDIM